MKSGLVWICTGLIINVYCKYPITILLLVIILVKTALQNKMRKPFLCTCFNCRHKTMADTRPFKNISIKGLSKYLPLLGSKCQFSIPHFKSKSN